MTFMVEQKLHIACFGLTLLLNQHGIGFHSPLMSSQENCFLPKLQAALFCSHFELNRLCLRLFVSLAYSYPIPPDVNKSRKKINPRKMIDKYLKVIYNSTRIQKLSVLPRRYLSNEVFIMKMFIFKIQVRNVSNCFKR